VVGQVRHVAIVGAGPAGLMAADVISAAGGVRVSIWERMPSVGRKFLMAGRGGLNLTHGEDIESFLARYGSGTPRLRAAIEAFPPAEVRAWCEGLGQPTFVGSSGRVFPQAMKTSPLLRAWLKRLGDRGIALHTRHRWTGWHEDGRLHFETPEGGRSTVADATVLALGGASWPSLGSDGRWTAILAAAGIEVSPLRPANCGFLVGWSEVFRERFEGEPLKRIAITHDGLTARGDAIVTAGGIEGGAIYPLSRGMREAILASGETTISLDLRPDIRTEVLAAAFTRSSQKQSISNVLRKAGQLQPAAIGLLQEHARACARPLSGFAPEDLASLVKAVPVRLAGVAPIDRAISSAGGVCLNEVGPDYMVPKRPGVFVAGEMLDWEAPTGGYLLQACFSTGAAAGRGVLEWLHRTG
jgi:hypothetical protein